MIRLRTILFATCAALLSLPLHAGVLTPGRWEITIKTVAPIETSPMTTEICISSAEAERPEPPKWKSTDDCQTVGSLHGNVLKYKTNCGKGKTASDVEFTYAADHYEGVVVVTTDSGTVRQIHTAKRIGDCDPDPGPIVVPPPPAPR